MRRVISRLMCSSAWCSPSNRTSGSASSVATLSLTLAAQIVRPLYDVPIENVRTIDGWAAWTAEMSATISAYVWKPSKPGGNSAPSAGEAAGTSSAAPSRAGTRARRTRCMGAGWPSRAREGMVRASGDPVAPSAVRPE